MDFTKELDWRGLISDETPGIRDIVSSEKITGYIGFDPTSKSLHIGNLLPIMNLVRLQKYGHKPLAVVGGGTGLIGDPSGKSSERNILSKESIQENLDSIKSQLEKFLDFSESIKNPAVILNNAEWLEKINYLDFLRDTGKHFTINYMMKKESVKSRLSRDTGISYTEFSYMTLQAYDYLYLYENYNCILQMGGSDQLGNIIAGVDLINKKNPGNSSPLAHGIVFPLITSNSGEKFGKTAGSAPTLDPKETSPYKLYQFFINTTDEDVINYIKYFTDLGEANINDIYNESLNNPKSRIAQKKLADIIVETVHGKDGLSDALRITDYFFKEEYNELSISDLEDLMESYPSSELSIKLLNSEISIGKLLVENNVFKSMGEMRRMSSQGALYINGERVTEITNNFNNSHLIQGKIMIIKKGSKEFFILKFS
ncbi:MAG: tyrosine--tRNA ligase [Dehalococcoidia bacterium]|nr:tyrosine--tRNA ligase [Dehalococcoidia bacterium]|tara:strand:+ start:289 stop:1572 length:1284 start_codon:yes stop_codon:yes gene_type:complete